MKTKHLHNRSIATVVIAVFITACSAAHAQNLLTNPSFELGTFTNRGDGFEILTDGSTGMTGWVVSDVLARGTTPNAGNIVPFDGAFFLDLQGDGLDGPPFGGVNQSFASTVGQLYHLSFTLGTQQSTPNGQGPVSVSATAGATTLPFTFNPGGTGTQWGQFGFDFTASSSSTPISIVGTANAGGAYIGLDLVTVTRAIHYHSLRSHRVADGSPPAQAQEPKRLIGRCSARGSSVCPDFIAYERHP